jgi:hypothetical protein
MFPVRYELGFHITDDILHSHRRENLNSYNAHEVGKGIQNKVSIRIVALMSYSCTLPFL